MRLEVNELSNGEFVALWVPRLTSSEVIVRAYSNTHEGALETLQTRLLELSRMSSEASDACE